MSRRLDENGEWMDYDNLKETAEFGLTNVGDKDVQKVPVEAKRERTELEKEVDAEIISKGEKATEDFDETQTLVIQPKKKRGRPKKAEETISKEFKCPTCEELVNERNVMKIGAGQDRWALFCPFCQKSLGFADSAFYAKIEKMQKGKRK